MTGPRATLPVGDQHDPLQVEFRVGIEQRAQVEAARVQVADLTEALQPQAVSLEARGVLRSQDAQHPAG